MADGVSKGSGVRPTGRMRLSSLSGPIKPWHSACSFICDMLDGVTSSLERYMDLLSARQKLVASNIANADTPGYKTQDVDFQFEFMTLAKGEQPQPIQAQGL